MFSRHEIKLTSCFVLISMNEFTMPNETKTLKYIYIIHCPYLSLQLWFESVSQTCTLQWLSVCEKNDASSASDRQQGCRQLPNKRSVVLQPCVFKNKNILATAVWSAKKNCAFFWPNNSGSYFSILAKKNCKTGDLKNWRLQNWRSFIGLSPLSACPT